MPVIFDTKGNIPEGSENWTTDQWADHYYNLEDDDAPDQYEVKLDDGTCPSCLGDMTWCSGCDMYSSYCCEEYGTCQCS